MKETVAESVQQAAVWWEESDLSQKLTEKAEDLCAAWNNSAIGKTVTAISTQVNKAAEVIGEKWNNSPLGQFCDKAANAVTEFYEEHKTAINLAVGAVVIGLCVVAVVATGPLGCSIWVTAAQGALIGSSVGAITGAAGGAASSAMEYMETYGTLDGSGSAILEGAAEGYAQGAISGAIEGFMGGAAYHVNNPKCFVAGTLIVTALGMSCVEDIRPGDYVYAKNEITGEQAYMPVLQTYENEIDVTYTITIDGESIETTAGHPFYTTDEGWTGADKLKAGDEVELSDGSSGTVESVERNELDEPVTIYNFTVMDYHTYYVGENEVLVHNTLGCGVDLDVKSGSKADVLAQNRANGRTFEKQEFAKFSSQNNKAVEQITVKTPSGVRTRVDAIGLDANGNVVINEYKSSLTAPLTNNQKIAFPEIFESGATVVGKGKGIFSDGYRIPQSTKVTIIRPE